ncbi:hypothetical protein MKZ38_004939 [Zalerion maritima]|uniref:Uncharacterized protein n=1 Tax=Zalerion maritima TaxID=339359 RepID=A0AAD5RL00_9PEZI|nr:hypothetical protein MKZ38_004939 [Zalerion maritima]
MEGGGLLSKADQGDPQEAAAVRTELAPSPRRRLFDVPEEAEVEGVLGGAKLDYRSGARLTEGVRIQIPINFIRVNSHVFIVKKRTWGLLE